MLDRQQIYYDEKAESPIREFGVVAGKIDAPKGDAAKKQPQEREISYICGLGAKVGCERLSEHSTCSDESHKYSLFLFLVASPLPAAN